ncbi:EAL domain-containing protein [Allohahella marinimesophila]|uniref:PAS domain S-box-containing protein/diguanylate cyclase (GGDEF)-like protein n=1 Tax=Allohahella marinimesophila TaxID=1054972 RepID=A0ABP7Q215_9GAMM
MSRISLVFREVLQILRGLCCALIILIASATEASGPQDAVTISGDTPSVLIGTQLQYLVDDSGDLTIGDLAALPDSHWRQAEADVPNFGFTSTAYWFRTTVLNESETSDLVLLLDYTAMDQVDLYVRPSGDNEASTPAEDWIHHSSGDRRPFDSRPLPYVSHAFPVQVQPGGSVDVLTRAQTRGNMIVPFWAMTQDNFEYDRLVLYTIFGGVFGILLITSLYNLLIWLRTKETVFAAFGVFAFSINALFAAQSGFWYQYFWPSGLVWPDELRVVVITTALAAHFWFASCFLESSPRARRLLHLALVASLIFSAAGLLLPYPLMLPVTLSFCLFCLLVSAVLALRQCLRGSSSARLYLLSMSWVLAGATASAAIRFQWLPYTQFTDMAATFGMVASVIALAMAVADLINDEKQQRLRAQGEAIGHLQRFEELYEQAVEGLFVTSVRGQLIRANSALVSMLGYDSFETMRRAINGEIIHAYAEPASRQALIEELKAEGKLVNRIATFRSRSGAELQVSLNMRLTETTSDDDQLIEGAVTDVTERLKQERALAWLAMHDPLTELHNRRYFNDVLKQVVHRKADIGHCMLYLDLDQFKIVNDTCGHPAGDRLLNEISQLLRQALRAEDVLARLGGDEFGVLLAHTTLADAELVAADILRTVQDYRFCEGGKMFSLGVSLGIAHFRGGHSSAELVMSMADSACHEAKESGRHQYRVYTGNADGLVGRRNDMALVTKLTRAVDDSLFVLHTQAIVRTTAIENSFGLEVLLRLRDDDDTLMAPASFLAVAERYHLMPRIDRWVISTALANVAQLMTTQPGLTHIAINLSGQSLSDPALADHILDELERHDVDGQLLCLEITESIATQRLDNTVELMNRLNQAGIRFALDDFGSGFSSYGYLKSLPVDFVKIDGRFITNMANDVVDQAMVRSIHEVARALGVETIAEYVENTATIDLLASIGVDYLQGYRVGRPVPIEPSGADDWS